MDRNLKLLGIKKEDVVAPLMGAWIETEHVNRKEMIFCRHMAIIFQENHYPTGWNGSPEDYSAWECTACGKMIKKPYIVPSKRDTMSILARRMAGVQPMNEATGLTFHMHLIEDTKTKT